ncbi:MULTISPECIES: acyltransferase [Sphingobacterium]|uniref:Acyltransferase n=1 Tax=Sphingobacterium populi TaxID=1812824 RepID=A0ABW5UCZ0_9SPHI|nr:acyltransferase [Sphingobacterium sp. CFCC 11742]
MLRKLLGSIVYIHLGLQGLSDRLLSVFYKSRFGSCGSSVMIKPCTSNFKGFENIHIGTGVRIARYAVIYSTNAKVFIGNNVGAAPYLSIISGNHSVGKVGHIMFEQSVDDKIEGEDQDVILEDDLWIGIRVSILSGVKIGRGSVIAAGSVVNKSCPPYSIIGGVPAKVLKFRFTVEEILQHEELVYTAEQRISKEQLIAQRSSYIQ